MNIKTIILMCLINQVLPNNGLVQLKSSLTTSDSPLLMKILQSVDAATSDEHLLEVTLKLLRSLCVCMRETLKAKEDKFNIENNSLESNEPSNSDGKVLDLYRKIYNNTCFNLRQELTNHSNKSIIEEETAFLNHTNCGKEEKNETQNIYDASDKFPTVTTPASSKLENVLFEALIQTKDYHRYRIKRYNLLGKGKLQTKNALQHRIIVILTLHPDVQEMPEKSYDVAEEDLNKTLHTKSPIDIDIIDPKHSKKLVENEEIKKLDNFSDCNILSLYKFLSESDQKNLTKVFKFLRKRETLKIYIEVNIAPNHTDYINDCCNNGTLLPQCNPGFRNDFNTQGEFYSNDSNPNEDENIRIKLKAVHSNYKKTVTKIKNLVKLYEDKLNDTSDKYDSSHSTHRNQHRKEKIFKPNLESTTKQTITIADQVYNENDIQRLVSDSNDPLKLGEVTRAILLLNDFVSKQTTKKVLNFHQVDKNDNYEELAHYQGNTTLPVRSTIDIHDYRETILNQNKLDKQYLNQSMNLLPIYKTYTNRKHFIENRLIQNKYISNSHLNVTLGITLPISLAKHKVKHGMQQKSDLKLDMENYVNNSFYNTAMDMAITDLSTIDKQGTTIANRRLSSVAHTPKYAVKPTKIAFLLSTKKGKPDSQTRFPDLGVFDKVNRTLQHYNVTNYPILRSTENTLALSVNNIKNLIENISYIDNTEKYLLTQLGTTSDDFKAVKKDLKYKKANRILSLNKLKPLAAISIYDKWREIKNRPNLSKNHKHIESSPLKGVDVVNLRSINVVANSKKELSKNFNSSISKTRGLSEIVLEEKTKKQDNYNIDVTLIPESNKTYRAPLQYTVFQETTNVSPIHWNKATLNLAPKKLSTVIHKNELVPLKIEPTHIVKKSNVVELITTPTLDVTVDELEQTLKKTVIKEIRNDTTKINNLNPEVSNVVKQDNLNDGVKNNKLEAINKSVLKSSILPFENTIKPMGTGENIRPISPTYEADNNNKIRQRITKPNYFLNNIISGMADKYPVTELMSTNDIKSTMNERTIITGLPNMPYHLSSVRSSEAPEIVTVRGLLDKKNRLPTNLEKLETLVQSQSPMTTVLIKNENNFHSNHAILVKRQYQANRIKNIELGITAVLSEKTTLLNENQTSDVQEIGNIVNEPPGKNQTEYLDKFTESASTISNILETTNNNVTSVKKNMSTINDQRIINEALSYLSQSTKNRSKKKLLLESDANKETLKKKPLDERLLIATDSSINEPTKDNSRLNIQSHTASMPKFENYVSKYTQNTDALNYLKDSLYTTAISTTFQNGTVPQPTLNYIPSRLSSSHPDVNKKTNFQNNNVNYFETFSPFLATKKNIWTTYSNRVIMGPDKTTKNVNREHASYGTQTITYTTEPLAAIEKQLSGQNPITFGFTKKIIELPEFGLLKRDTVIEHIIERPVVVLNLGNQTLNAYQSISNTTGEPRQNENLYIETSTVKYTIPEISFTTRRNVFNLNLLEPVSSDKAQNHFNGNNTFKTEDMGRNDIFQTESGDGETENILKMKLLQIFGKKFNKTSNDFTLQEKKSSLKTTERDLVKPPLKFPETFFTPEWYTSQTAMTEINAENHSTLYDKLIDRSHIKEIILVNESLTPVIEDSKTSVDLVRNINAKGILNSSNAKTKLNSSIAFVHTIRVGGEANKKRIKIAASNYNEKLFEKSKLKLLAAKVLENSVTQRINILNIQTEPTQKALNDIKIKNITFNDVQVRNEIETNDTVTHDKNLNNIIIKDMNWTRKSNVMYDNEDLTKIATILNTLAWKPPPKIKGNNTQNNTMRTMENITISLANITSDGIEPPRMNASTEPWFKSAKNKNVTNFIHKSRKPGALTENLDVDQIQSVYYKNMKTIKENFNGTKNKSAANILEKIYEDVISSSLKKNKQPNNNNSQLDYVSENKNTFQQFKNFKGIKNNLVKVLHAKSELILQKTYNSSKTPSLKSKRLRKVLNHLLEGKKLNKHHRKKLIRKKIKRFKNNHKDVEKNKINANAIKNLTSNPKSNTTTVKVQHSPEKENEQTTIPTRFVDNKAIKTNTLFKTNSTQAISMPIMFNASLESAAKDTRRNFGTSNSDSDSSDQIEFISFECESETILPNTTSELNTRVPTPNNVTAMSRFWGMILDETDEIENSSKGSEDQTKTNGIVLKSDVMNLTTIKPNGTDNINNTKVIIISNKSLRIPKNIKVEGAAAQKSNRSRVKEILETIDVIQQSVDQLLLTINDTTLIKEDTTNKILLSSENSYNDKHASTSNVTERTSVTTHLLSENELNKSNKITVSMNDLINTTEATHTVQNIFDSVDDLIQELDDVLTQDTINSTSPYANTNSKTNTGQSDSNIATVSTYTSNTEYEYYTQTNKREQKVNKGSYLTPTEFTTRNEYFKYIGPLSVNTSTTINAHDFKLDRKTTGFPFMSSTEVGTEIPTAEYQTNEISQTMHEPTTEISKIINNTNIDYNVTHDTDKIKIDKNQNRSDETGFYINLNNMNTDKLKLMIPPKSDERFLQENKWTSQIFPMKTIAYNSTDTIIKRETLPKLNTLTNMPNNFTTRTDISKYVSETKEISSEFNNFNATEQPSSIVLINQSRELKSTQQMVKGLSKSSDTLDLSMATSIPKDNIDYAKKNFGIKILNENDIKEKHNDSLNSGPAEITTKPVISKNGTQLLLRTDILNLGEPSKNKGVTIYKANSVFEVTTKIPSPVTLNEETLVATKGEEIKSFTLKSKFERTVPFAASTTTEMPVENKFTDAEIEIFKENYIEKSNLYEKIPSTDIFTEKVITKAGDINTNQSFLSASLKRIKIHENNISDNFPILDDENYTTGIVLITDTTKLPIASVSKNKSTLFSATEGSNVTTDIVVVGVDSLNIHDKVTYQQKYNDTQSTLDTVTSHLGLLENTLTAYKSYSLNVKKSGQYEDAVKDKNTRNTSTTRLTSLPTFIDKTYKSEEVTLPYSVAIDAAEIHSTNMTQEEKNKYQKKLNKIIDNSLKEEILSKNIITLPAANMSINKGEEIIISDVLGTSPPVVWNLSTTLQIPMVDYTLKTEMHHIETNYGELYSPQVVSTSNDNVTSMKEEDFIFLSTSTEHSEETMSYKEKFGVFKSTLPLVLTSSETAHESLGFTDNPESERFTKKVNGYEDFIQTPHASLYVENVTHIPKKESALITTLQKYRNIQKGNVSDNSNILIANHIKTIKNISTDTPNAKTFADKSNQNKSKTIHTILTTWDVDQRTTGAISVEDNSTETRDKEKFNKLFIGEEVTTLDNLYRESYKEQNNAHLNINNASNEKYVMRKKKMTGSDIGMNYATTTGKVPNITTTSGSYIGMLESSPNTTNTVTFKSKINGHSNDLKRQPLFSTQKLLTEENTDDNSIVSTYTKQPPKSNTFIIKTTGTILSHENLNVLNALVSFLQNSTTAMHMLMDADFAKSLNKDAFTETVTEKLIYLKTEPTSLSFNIFNKSTATATATTATVTHETDNFYAIDETTLKFVPKNTMPLKIETEEINYSDMTTTEANRFLSYVANETYRIHRNSSLIENKKILDTDPLKSIISQYKLKLLNTTKNIIILDSNTREKVLNRSIINKNKTSQAHIDNDLEINKISSKLNVYNNITVNKNAKQLTNLSSMLSLHKENTTHEVTKPCLLLIGHEKNKSRIITNTMESLAVTIKDMPIKDTKLKKNIMFKIKTDTSKVIKLEKKAQTNESKPHKIKSIYFSRDTLESSNRNTSNMLQSNNTSKIKFVVKIHDGAKNISYIHTPELTQVKVTKLKLVNKTNIQELLPVSQNKINKFRPYQTNKNRSELNSLDKDYRSLFTNTDVGRFKGEKSVQIYSSRVYRPYSSHTTATAVTKMIKYNTYQPTTKEDLELLNFDNQPLFNTPVHNMDYEKLHHQKQALNSSCTVLRNLKNKFNSAAEFSEVLKAANCTEDEQMINAKDQSNNDLHIKQEINRNEHPPAENNEKTHSIEIDKISNPILEININSPQLGISKDSPPMIEIKGNPLPMEIQRNMFPVVDVNRHALPIEIIKNPSSLLNIHRNSLSMMEIIDPLLIQNNRNSLQMEINKNQAQYNEINRNSQENNGNLSPVGEFNRNMEKNSPILEIKKNQPPMVNIIRHFPLYMEINRNSPPIEINPNGSTIAINRYFRWKPPMIGIARDSPSMIDIDMNSPQMIENSRIARPMVDMGRNSPSIFDINTNAAQIVGLNNNASPKDAINMNWPTLDKVNGTPTMISNDGNSRSIFDMQKNSDPIIGINGNLSPMVNKNRNIYSMVQMSNSPEIIDITRNSLTYGIRNVPQGGDINSPSLVDNNRNYTSVNTSSLNDANRKLPSIDLGNNYRSMLDMVGKSPPIFNPLFNPYSPSMVDIDKNPASMIATSKNSVSVVDNSRNSPVMADINRNFPSMPEMSINSPSMIAKSVNSPSMLEMNRNLPSVVGMDSNSSSMFDMNIKSPTMDSNKNYLSALGMGGSSFSFFDMNRNSPSVFFNRNSPSVFDVNRNSHSVSDMSKNSPSLADMNRNPPSIIDMNRNSPSVDLKDNSHLMLDTSRNLPSIFNMNYSPSLVGMAKDSSSIIDMSRSLPSMVNIIRNPLTISDTNTNSPSIFDINRNYLPSMFDMNRNSPSMVDTRKKSPSMLGNNRNLISMLDMNKKSPSIIDINSNSPSMLDTNRNLASMININSNSPSVLDLNRDSPSMIDINGNSHSVLNMNRNLPRMIDINGNSHSILDMNRNLPSMIDINGNSHSVLNMNRNSPRMIDINGNSHSIRDMNRNLPSIIDINSNSPSVLDMSRNSASMMNINRNSPSVLDTNRNSASKININSNSPSVLDTNRNSASMININSNSPSVLDTNRNSASLININSNSPSVLDMNRNSPSMIDINGNSPSRLDKNSNSPSMVDIDRNSASVVDMSRNSPSVVDISKNLSSINSISRNSPSIVVANRNSSTINDTDIKLLRTQQNIPLKNNNPTKETRKIAHPIIESNMIRGPKKLKNKKSNILVQNNKIPFNKGTKRKSHPMVGIHKNTHPPIEINRNVHFNIVTRNFKKTGLQKDAFLNPFRKAISYTAKVASPKLPTKTMKRMKLGIRRKEVMTMNTQDFFSQHRVVTQQNLVRKFTKPKSVIFKPRPIPKFSVLHPKFDSIDKAKRFEHIMRPKPLLLKPKHDEFEEALFKHHRPDTSKWHKNLVHNFQSAGVTRNKVRVNNVLDRPLWHSTSKPKFSKEKINVMRNFLYTADYLKVTRRPIFNEELRIPIDSDSSNDNYKPSAFYHRRTEADDEEITTEAVRTPRSRRTIFFLSPTVTDWWLDDMYLKVRLPLPINSNPGMVFPRRHFAKMDEVADLGALFIDDLLDYKEMLDRGELPLERATSREKGQPLCMEQFYRLLGVCRIPEVGKDRLELPQVRHGTEESEELVVVACRNYFYPIPVKAADRGRLTPGEMQAQLLHAMVDAAGAPPAPRVGLLTSMNRDQWARAREQLIKDEMNRMNLELISRALCILCLDEAGGDRADTDSDTNAMLRAMHGAGTRYHSANRWFDKTVQLIISSDGTVGMCYEHSSAEGVAVVRLAERALARAEVADRPAPPPALLPAPQAMKWNVPTDVQRTIETAARDLDRAISDLDHKVYTYRGYGREFMKSCRTSPDVFIQLALQYAYYKMYGYLVTTYESASLRRFRNGRVDNIRSAHAAALSWAAAMCTAETSPLNDTGEDGQRKVSFNLYGEQKKLELFEEAARKQTSIMEANILGKGIDNHLLGLREAARETLGELPQVFSDATYKQMIEFKLSTSQVTTTTDGTFMGYGAVCSDGYGCSYNPKKDSVIFCISSFTSSSVTNTEAFRQSLEEALDSMKLMFQARKTDN